MAAMRTVGENHRLPPHAHVREVDGRYVIELDVSDFTERELTVELLSRRLTVRGDQLELPDDDVEAFRMHERLEESFSLPEDADLHEIKVFYRHGSLEIEVPRTGLVPRRLAIEPRPTAVINPNAEAC
jgi:HSP20 family molecular chaperone IbpA